MTWWRRLGTRLFVSYAAVAAAGAAVLLVTIRLLVPRLFDDHLGNGPGGAGRGRATHDALVASLDTALVIAVLASLVAASFIAAVVARRILGPIDRVRTATRHLAAGHYDEKIDRPTEAELAALADDVNALAQSLADTEQRRAELIGDVAHELRTPLTTIRGYAEGMLDGIIAPDTEVLTAVLGEVDRLQRLAGDLSTLSQVDEGRVPLTDALVDLRDVAASVVDSFRPRALAADIELGLAGSSAAVRGDRDRLVQVLTNLVANAISYTPAGGRVVVQVAVSGRTAMATVTDTGIGLAPDDLEHVFERFYRVSGVDRPPGGSGIGLSIARTLARAHRGDLTVASPGPGEGTTLTLWLPVAFEPEDQEV